MAPRSFACLLAAALVAGCITSEDAYVEAVRRHVAKGPSAACCTATWDGSEGRARMAECERGAEARCAFARGAEVRALQVSRFGHDDGATVDVEVHGPGGSGRCTFQVLNERRAGLRIDGGACEPR